jgi:transposase-like protein
MNKSFASATVARKIDRTSYRCNARQFGLGIFPEPPSAPTLTPSQLQAQIAEDLVRIRELGQRQDALAAKIRNDRRRAAWAARVDEIYSGVDY